VRAGWALLRRRDFGLLWTGGLISEAGDWFLLVGLPVWVLQVTGSSLVTATVFLVGLLPSLVVGPLAGVLVDRWDRRRTLVAVSLAQAGFLLPLLAVDGRDRLWIVYLVMAVEAALAQLNDPARNALVPALVGREELVGANALVGLNGNLARLVGSPLGGVVVEVAGLPGLVIGDAVSFLAGAALIALVRPPPDTAPVARPRPTPAHLVRPRPNPPRRWWGPRFGRVAQDRESRVGLSTAQDRESRVGLSTAQDRGSGIGLSTAQDRGSGVGLSTAPGPATPAAAASPTPVVRQVVAEWVDGLRVLVGVRRLRWALVVNGLAAVAQGVFTVLFVVFVARELGGDGADVGLLRGVQAIGGLLGGVLVVGLARRLEAGRLAAVSLLGFGAVDLAIWNGPLLTTALALYLGLFVAAGVPGIGFLTGLTALVQEGTDDAYLGRVFASFYGVFNGLTAVGILAAGLLGDAVGVVAVLNGQAGLYLLAGVVAWLALARPAPDRYPRTSKRARMPLA
jgi:MFS family permease